MLVENFKVGDLARYGLGYEQLATEFPRLVYCSITGFGQTGPYAPRAGYDYLAQGLGGIMSITGAADGPPMKVGVGIADVMCGMYATVGDPRGAAPPRRDRRRPAASTSRCWTRRSPGWSNEATNYLVSGQVPQRLGNEHPNIVPYNDLRDQPTATCILAVGNDGQFQKWCRFAGAAELAGDPRFATNSLRVRHRRELYALMPALVCGAKPTARLGRRSGGAGRAVQPGQRHRPGVRGPAGAGPRHADRSAARDRRRRHRAAGRQPDPHERGPRPPTATAHRRWASTPMRCWPSCCGSDSAERERAARRRHDRLSCWQPTLPLPSGSKNSRSSAEAGVAAIPP